MGSVPMLDIIGPAPVSFCVMRTSSENHGCLTGFSSEWRRLRSLACMFGFAMGVVPVGAVVIDSFSQGAALLEPTNYSPAVVVLQTGLDTNLSIGGTRRLSAQTQNRATLQVDAVAGEMSFEAITNFGYFAVEYGIESPLSVDLRADGSDAFLLTFSNVSMPGLWRGGYTFRVNGMRYDLLHDLQVINGSGTVRIPFSYFSTAPQFVANQISLAASRVESQYRLVLDSIVTVNSNTPPKLGVATPVGGEIQLLWSTNATDFVVETTPTIGLIPWQRVSNAVSVVGDHFSVTLGASQASGYFRLRRE